MLTGQQRGERTTTHAGGAASLGPAAGTKTGDGLRCLTHSRAGFHRPCKGPTAVAVSPFTPVSNPFAHVSFASILPFLPAIPSQQRWPGAYVQAPPTCGAGGVCRGRTAAGLAASGWAQGRRVPVLSLLPHQLQANEAAGLLGRENVHAGGQLAQLGQGQCAAAGGQFGGRKLPSGFFNEQLSRSKEQGARSEWNVMLSAVEASRVW